MNDLVNTLQSGWSTIQSWEIGITALPYGVRVEKSLFLIIVLYIALKIIGLVNGIRGTETWSVHVRTGNGHAGKVRLPRTVDASKYNDRSGTVEFRELPSPNRPWWKKLFGFGRPKLLYSDDCVFSVPLAGPKLEGLIHVDQETAEKIATAIHGGELEGSNTQVQTILIQTTLNVTARRTNSIKFLLNHPDPTLKTTAWVVLVTALFEIFRSLIFEA
jgi:hypothetical protein